MVVTVDTRVSTTGLKADLILPAAATTRSAASSTRRAGALRRLRRPGDGAAGRVEARVGNHGSAGAAHPGTGAGARDPGLPGNDLRSVH